MTATATIRASQTNGQTTDSNATIARTLKDVHAGHAYECIIIKTDAIIHITRTHVWTTTHDAGYRILSKQKFDWDTFDVYNKLDVMNDEWVKVIELRGRNTAFIYVPVDEFVDVSGGTA